MVRKSEEILIRGEKHHIYELDVETIWAVEKRDPTTDDLYIVSNFSTVDIDTLIDGEAFRISKAVFKFTFGENPTTEPPTGRATIDYTIAMLIRHGHSNVLNYPYSFFAICVEEVQEDKSAILSAMYQKLDYKTLKGFLNGSR